MDFKTEDISLSENGWAACLGVAAKARVEKIVSINPDGTLSEETEVPGRDVWFLMDCISKAGTGFTIAYDGEAKWLPVLRNPHLCIGMPLNVPVEQICIRDKELFDKATSAIG